MLVGLPLTSTGESGPRAQRTLGFVRLLRGRLDCPVETVDERYTTDEAHALLGELKASRRKKLVDSVAALVILNRFRSS